MRFVAIAIIILSLPAFIAFIGQNKARRDMALIALGAMCFASGALQIDAAIISWPTWQGTVKGIIISPIDTLALALIVTRANSFRFSAFAALIVAFIIPILVSIAVSVNPMASTFTLFQMCRMLLVFVAVSGELARPSALRHLLMGLSFGLIVQAGFVIQQKLGGVVQASGTMSHQNVLGMLIELTLLPLIAAILEGEKSKIFYAGITAGLLAIAGGGSRGTMAFAAIAIVLLLLFSLWRRPSARKFKLVGGAVIAAMVFVPLSIATLQDRFQGESFVFEESQRNAFERAATEMADDHLLGVGANGFVIVSNLQGYADRAGVAWNMGNRAAPVHNAYLLARAETGWLGMIALIALLVAPMIIGIRMAFKDRTSLFGGIALGSSTALLALVVHNNFEYAWFAEHPQRLFFINLAIIAACARNVRKGAHLHAPAAPSDSDGPNPADPNPDNPNPAGPTRGRKPLVWQPSAQLAGAASGSNQLGNRIGREMRAANEDGES
jgi:hypothetical protein